VKGRDADLIHSFAVLGGDARQNYLFRKLLAAGFEADCWQVPGLANTKPGLYETLCRAEAAVLPMPALRGAEHVRAEGAEIPLRSVLESLPRGAAVLGGGLAAAAELLRQYPVRVVDYAAAEPLATLNAVPTAEGAIQIAMEKLPVTIHGSRFLVVGFGRIGKALAPRLAALGGLVTVAARRPGDCALAESFGCQSDRTGLYLRGLARYDCIFNTVPAPVLSADDFAAMRPDCLVIDLASGRGGADERGVPAGGPVYLRAPGLPGKAAPATAAEYLKNAVLDALTAP
jgi:dipicolinate synthase subunit A